MHTRGVITVNRPTTVKTRVIAHHQQMVRVDREQRGQLPPRTVGRLIDAVRRGLREADAIIIEDYGKGVITRPLLEAGVPLADRKSTRLNSSHSFISYS